MSLLIYYSVRSLVDVFYKDVHDLILIIVDEAVEEISWRLNCVLIASDASTVIKLGTCYYPLNTYVQFLSIGGDPRGNIL